jgi:hypothetical protein
MDFHANHALGLPQRLALVQAIERGSTLRAAAAALSVAPATAGGTAFVSPPRSSGAR